MLPYIRHLAELKDGFNKVKNTKNNHRVDPNGSSHSMRHRDMRSMRI